MLPVCVSICVSCVCLTAWHVTFLLSKPFKAIRVAIADLNLFGALGRLNFGGFIYIRYVTPTYAAGTVIIASVYGRWVKTPVLAFSI